MPRRMLDPYVTPRYTHRTTNHETVMATAMDCGLVRLHMVHLLCTILL